MHVLRPLFLRITRALQGRDSTQRKTAQDFALRQCLAGKRLLGHSLEPDPHQAL